MGVIRVLLAEVPGLMAAVVRQAILTQPDMTIVGETRGSDELGPVMSRGHVDVVVVTSQAGSGVPTPAQRLLFGPPHVALVAISADGRCVGIYDHKVVREVTPERLVDVIREVVRERRAYEVGSESE